MEAAQRLTTAGHRVDADLVVVGSGPGGCAAALEGASAGLATVLVEARAFPRTRPGESLHPGVESVLERLGVGDVLRRGRYRRYPGLWVGRGRSLAFRPFGHEGKETWRGFHAPGADLDLRLQRAAVARGARLLRARAERALVAGGRVVGVVTSQGPLRSRFVVDAAGRGHWLARQLGLAVVRRSPELTAVFGYARGPRRLLPREPQVRGEPQGWTWIAEIEPGLYQWTRLSPSHLVREGLGPPAPLAGLRAVGRTLGADMTWRSVEPAAGPGYFLVGDAAAVLDPASSHGVLRALMSGMLAGFLVAGLRKGMSRAQAARGYAEWMAEWFEHDRRALRALYRTSATSRGPVLASRGPAS